MRRCPVQRIPDGEISRLNLRSGCVPISADVEFVEPFAPGVQQRRGEGHVLVRTIGAADRAAAPKRSRLGSRRWVRKLNGDKEGRRELRAPSGAMSPMLNSTLLFAEMVPRARDRMQGDDPSTRIVPPFSGGPGAQPRAAGSKIGGRRSGDRPFARRTERKDPHGRRRRRGPGAGRAGPR